MVNTTHHCYFIILVCAWKTIESVCTVKTNQPGHPFILIRACIVFMKMNGWRSVGFKGYNIPQLKLENKTELFLLDYLIAVFSFIVRRQTFLGEILAAIHFQERCLYENFCQQNYHSLPYKDNVCITFSKLYALF